MMLLRRCLQSRGAARWASAAAFAANAILLAAYHCCHAAAPRGGTTPDDEERPNRTTTEDSEPPPSKAFESHLDHLLRFQFTTLDYALFGALATLAFELLNFLCKNSGKWFHFKQIPVRGKHLDDFSAKDILFIGISKANTAPFIYFYLRYAFYSSSVVWDVKRMTLANTVLPLIPLFLVFDFWYTLLHWALHIKAIYGCIHKHHHHQKAPSRANIDAVNVHPIEYLLGEYNHLWTLHLVGSVVPVHIAAALLFLVVGGVLAGLNHTRFDVQWSVAGVTVYDSKVHDVHHRVPQSNYGQYTMFWDRLFGSFRPYNPSDRVNPDAQLDPKTGKTVHHQRPSKQEKAQ